MNIRNIIEDYNTRLHEMRVGLTETLKSSFKEVFEENPNLYMICWTQYAPYFNDGEPCVFSVHDMYAVHKDILQNEDYDEESLPNPWGFEDEFSEYRMKIPSSYDKERLAAYNASSVENKNEIERIENFLKIISSIDEDIFEIAFGEDNAVYVFKDKIISENFSDNHE